MKNNLAMLVSSLVFAFSGLHAQSLQPTDLGSALPTQNIGLTAKTVFVAKAGDRKGDSAAAITAMHEKMGAQGWTVIDVDIYVENGDQWGFFITYIQQEQDWVATD